MQAFSSLPKVYWEQDASSLFQILSSRADGLTQAEADQRLKSDGPNVLQARAQATPLGLFLNQFKSPIILIWIGRAGQSLFHTGWFVESVLSATLLVFALRTRKPSRQSRSARAMVLVTLLVMLVALILPVSPMAGVMSFTSLPAHYLVAIAGIVLGYFLSAGLAKRWYYRSIRPRPARKNPLPEFLPVSIDCYFFR